MTEATSMSPAGKRSQEKARSLREKEYAEAALEIAKMFGALESSCKKVDSSVDELKTVLISLVALDKRMNILWASRDLRLSKRLLMVRMIKDVGTAAQKLGQTTKVIRAILGVVKSDVRQALDPKRPKDSVFE